MIPVDVSTAPPAPTVVVRVAEVVTTVSDGLPRRLHAGRFTVALPVWAAPNASARTAHLAVGPATCASVELRAGAVARVACTVAARAGSSVTVTLATDRGTVARWRHTVR